MSVERRCAAPLPEPWVTGGGDESESAAAALLQRVLAEVPAEPHPAVGARMRAQIATRLGDRAQSRRRTLHLGLATAGVAAAAFVVFVALPRTDTADIRQVLRGELFALGPDGPEPLAVGAQIAAGQQVRCAGEECEIGVGTGVRVVLPRAAVFSIASGDRTEVHAGVAAFTVEPLPPGETFAVWANDTAVQVVGTAFSVERVDAARERVAVTHGTVRVLHDGREIYVRAGERWPVSGQRDRAPAAQDAEPQPAASPPPPAASAPGPAAMIERAETLIRAGDLDGARRIYVDLAALPGASGELGLYHLARLDLHRRHAAEAARATLTEMARRYPGGALAVERNLTELEAWIRLGECIEARDGVARFRRDFPGSVEMLAPIEAAMTAAGCAP